MAFGIDDIVGGVLGIVNKFIPDPKDKEAAEGALRNYLSTQDLGQLSVNTAEAQNSNVFVAGWRPFIGWVCGSALAYQYVVCPIGIWAAALFGHNVPSPPTLDNSLWELMFGMLGMGGLRTYEKLKGVARK